jgi:3-dehydroquinate dehydratase
MGDLFDPSCYELTLDRKAVQKQKDLIAQIHDLGGKVVMSSHMPHARTAEEILWHLREEESRGADLLKIVTRADNGDELAEAMRTTPLLKQALSKPFIQLCNGKFSRIHRYMGPKLGCAVAFAMLDETPESQPSIRNFKTVLQTINFPPQ